MADNIARVFADAIAPDPTRPLLTWYDDATGERTELSGATCANWVAKTANLIVDGLGLGPGDTAGVLLPPHWQTATLLLGCWSAGLAVTDQPGVSDVLFVVAGRLTEPDGWSVGDRYVLGLDPFALPMRQVPPGFADFVSEVRVHGDHFRPYPDGGPDDADLLARATARATELGVTAGDRILIDVDRHPDPVDWLLAPLAAGATVVLCAHPDPARMPDRFATEKVTRPLT
ncbi:TIGR03089 family protein [Micromonospora sp. WMMA1363]|uniref:TIGR03089 family protein n=1 Tax=Micromonospora sp. WMMA1363 TaxID=3053985 RepID=UPI00259CEDB9|nr:TIGR03089 family protein [Micromonospora sp. WMMA1363]MDM4722577.1 TIGR03089 family protein [Micromonospora sp. WMMA1363]